jgi:hypothetical protein
MWVETKDDRIIEVEIVTETEVMGREVLYKADTPKLRYGSRVRVNKGDVIWN